MRKELVKDLGFDFLKNKTKREIEKITYLGDGVYFLGEVNGTDFITYDEFLEWLCLEDDYLAGDSYISLGNDKKTKGNWLYFADSKYRDKGQTRFFYIAKKPILRNVSWDFLNEKNCVYGTDIKEAHVTAIAVNDEEYMIRLPYGIGNFSTENSVDKINFLEDIKEKKIKSEWDRTIVALIDNPNLKYSWLKDLNLKATKNLLDTKKGIPAGQWNLCQELVDDFDVICVRGSGFPNLKNGAEAFSSTEKLEHEYFLGYRPVIEAFID